MHNMKGLLPSTLPPLSTTLTSRGDGLTTLGTSKKKLPTVSGSAPGLLRSSTSGNSMISSLAGSDSRLQEGSEISLFAELEGGIGNGTTGGISQHKGMSKKSSTSNVNKRGSTDRGIGKEGQLTGSNLSSSVLGESESQETSQLMNFNHTHHHVSSSSFSSSIGAGEGKFRSRYDSDGFPLEDDNRSDTEGSQYSHESTSDELMLLSSRPFAIPFDSKNCLVQVYASRAYDENIRLRVISSGINPQKLLERILPIDKAYEIINAGGQSSQIMHSTDNEDLQSLSTMLINMFKEADDDGSGSLTFDEFQKLMEQVELGISAQELRFVISEADENENGVVDYEEFVPLAVDLIQSFRARNRAKTMNSQEDVLVDDQIIAAISTTELKKASDVCLEKIFEFDSKRYGLIRVPDLKKCLNAVAPFAGLAESEISMLCQLLPRDQFGRIKYNATVTTFYDSLSKVRFMTMKNAIIESQGSGLQKYLLDLCKDEEKKLANYHSPTTSSGVSSSMSTGGGGMKGGGSGGEKFVPTGIIPCRSLINILSNSPRLSLSRLQVLVIMSEASVLDGMINYFQFVPVVAKAIEIMFEPRALRQRAELIEKTDLSPEALLQGMSSEMFEQRLLTLFKSYDIDHNGTLDQNEFIACLESLDLQLSYGEMVALMATADVAQHGFLKFEDFVGFFTHNLLNLEREKHIRLLQSSLHKSKNTGSSSFDKDGSNNNNNNGNNGGGGGNGNSNIKDASDDLTSRLLALFRLSDPGHTGFIPFDDFETILQNLSINVSKFLIDVLVSELHVNDDGLVEYASSLKTCTELFRVSFSLSLCLYFA
jgi:Ca2+-binding EF-hand superfamily protein